MSEHKKENDRENLQRILATAIGVMLTFVIVAPIVLSSQDLVKWAADPKGLNLPAYMAWVVFLALDLAAGTCVGMVTYSAWRGESGGMFHVLTWAFAFASAFANYRFNSTKAMKDAQWFFPAMSIMGPLLLDVTLARVRRWTRIDEGTQMSARPKFGMRWIPGVAFKETAKAWAAARRENIEKSTDAIAYVREVAVLEPMTDQDAIRYAWSALGTYDEYTARKWLTARNKIVSQSAMDEATEGKPRTPLAAPNTPPAITGGPSVSPKPALPAGPVSDSDALAECKTKRDKIRHAFAAIGDYDVPKAVNWLAERGVSVDRADAYAVKNKALEEHNVTRLERKNGTN